MIYMGKERISLREAWGGRGMETIDLIYKVGYFHNMRGGVISVFKTAI